MLLTLQNIILEKIATGQSLAETVDYLCREVETTAGDIVCSVLLLDEGRRLRHLAGPSLPLEYTSAIDGIAIGPGVGSCGTAARRRSASGCSGYAISASIACSSWNCRAARRSRRA